LVFFDKKSWSYHATILVIIPIALLLLLTGRLGVQDMIFLSLLGMMKGNLLPKTLMTGFLCLLVFVPTAGWIKRSAIYVLSIVLMDGIRMDNVVERTIMKSQVLQLIIKLLIVAWMGFISYSIISDVYHKWSNVWIE